MAEFPAFPVSSSVVSLQSALVTCQPRSLVSFSLRYLQDEKQCSSNSLYIYHAIQMLPYLITQPDDMKDMACTIFCAIQTQGMVNERGIGNVESLPNPPLSGAVSAATTTPNATTFREYLDGNQVSEIIQLMDLPSLGQSHSIVDEILIDRIESLKRVDFSLFFASIRLYLNVYQAISWLKDDMLDYLWTTEYVLRVPVPLNDDFSIELTKWKVTLLKRAASNTSNLSSSLGATKAGTKQALRQGPSRFTHNYHLHGHQSATQVALLLNTDTSLSGHHNNYYGDQDVAHWKRILLNILEEERTAMMISVGTVVERFVKSLLEYK